MSRPYWILKVDVTLKQIFYGISIGKLLWIEENDASFVSNILKS